MFLRITKLFKSNHLESTDIYNLESISEMQYNNYCVSYYRNKKYCNIFIVFFFNTKLEI